MIRDPKIILVGKPFFRPLEKLDLVISPENFSIHFSIRISGLKFSIIIATKIRRHEEKKSFK
jgi:hypothetical protein